MALIMSVPGEVVDGPTLTPAKPKTLGAAPEGSYVALVALAPANQALLVDALTDTGAVALILPLDSLFEARLDTARRLWRAVVRRSRVAPATFTVQRRRRLKLVLRALDGDLEGADYRTIAQGLFGGRVPTDAVWRNHYLRSFTIRLVHDGRALMRGGYLNLLRSDRRSR